MGIDDLKAEITQYHLQVEEVLSGMDRAITEIGNRLRKLERGSESEPTDQEQQIRTLESRIVTGKRRVAPRCETVRHAAGRPGGRSLRGLSFE